MSRQLADLESLLQQLVAEHRKLLGQMEIQQSAMKKFDLKTMEAAAAAQESSRLRIAALEGRRQLVVTQLARVSRAAGPLNIAQIAALFPPRAKALFALRDELKDVAGAVSQKTYICSKIANAVLGHLNTAVRLLAGAVERAGVYTKQGIPQVSGRIGVMEAVG